jgi:hypothetical protein
MNLESTITDVIENFTTFPKLAVGTAISAVGAISGDSPSVESVPKLQILVWAVTILAGASTIALAFVRGYIEWKKAKKENII